MDKHIRAAGILNAIFGLVMLALIGAWLIAAGGFRGIFYSFNNLAIGLVVVVLCASHLLAAIPCIAGGFGVRGFRDWARTLLTVTSALNILNLPLGTILGCYSLWALTTSESDPLFHDPPFPHGGKRAAPRAATSAPPLQRRAPATPPRP